MRNESTSPNKRRYNALDVTVVLFVVLLLLGAVGRVMLDRKRDKGLEERTISFTCVLPLLEQDVLIEGKAVYTASGENLGRITEITETIAVSESLDDAPDQYVMITGSILVEGYETKKGVFHTSYGDSLRINTFIPLLDGENICIYINDIVENGQ